MKVNSQNACKEISKGGLQSRCVLAKGHVPQRLQLDSLAMQPTERTRHACHFYVQRNGIFRKTVYGMTDGTQTQLGFEQCSNNQSTKRMGGSNANEDSFGSFCVVEWRTCRLTESFCDHATRS